MGFQQLYTEQQVVNIVEQIGSRDMNYWLQAVDSVFLGIAPEIEILKAPITVTLTSQHLDGAESWGGVVNNNYSYDLIEGKNYVVKATAGKLNGESQEVELSAIATLSTSSIKQPFLSFAVENDLHFTLEDKVHFKFTEPYYTEGEDFSLVSATDASSKPYAWSYVTVHSLIQKEAGPTPGANLLKEPIAVTAEEAAEDPVIKFTGYTLGLEIGKPYVVGINIGGVEYSIPAITMDGGALEGFESLGSVPILSSDRLAVPSEGPEGRIVVYVYDGVELSGEEPSKGDNAYVGISTRYITTSFEVNSIKEVDVVDDWAIPLVTTIENPQKEVVYKYYNKTSSLFAENQNIKITGSIVIDGASHTFDETVQTEQMGQSGYKIDVNITEIDQSFSIGDGLLLDENGTEANYVTLLINNAYPDGSPMSELRIDSITVS